MPDAPFPTVEGWDSWENQGAGVAVADLGGTGTVDLIVLRVDAPDGPNVASYRVGHGLDAAGGVTGWGPWLDVPGWDSDRDEGAGLAVAHLGPSGLCLVVLQVRDRGDAANNGRYRIGRTLDDQGVVQGGWSPWRDVPDWGSFRDQGAAVTVADLDGDGRPELLVLHVDDRHTDRPDLPNRAFYRVGRALGPDGQVGEWSPWRTVDWDSDRNQGAGVALADLTGTGSADLVVLQIDAPDGENRGRYRVGWDVDVDGAVADGWGPWATVDGWDSWEDQGGGLALARFGADVRPRAVILHVDNPPRENAGRYLVRELELDIDQAATTGLRRLLPYPSEVLPVHAGLLHTGKILFFAGSGNNAFRRTSPQFGTADVATSVVWDPTTATFDHPPTLRRPDGSVVDLFCCGHCMLTDGRMLAVGGSDRYDVDIVDGRARPAGHGFTGLRDAMVFDPGTERWALVDAMDHGRWYPTALTLADGRVIAVSGLDVDGKATDVIEKIADPGAGTWAFARTFGLPLYPHLFLTADGLIVYTGGKMDTEGDSDPLLFDPLKPSQSIPIDDLDDRDKCNQSASVVLPPAQKQRFMILGGGPEDVDGQPRQPATTRVSIVDLKAPVRRFRAAAPLKHERMHVNAVLLPDRTVLATGGGVTREATVGGVVDPQAFNEVFEAEIYDPVADTWTSTAPATVARLYHSVALLLPDGRVVTAGGNPDKGSSVTWLPPEDPMEEMRLEIYSPPYLFRADAARPRPTITAPTRIAYDTPFPVASTHTGALPALCLIRPGLTTHSFNGEQRLVDVAVRDAAPGTLEARVDVDARIAVPGWYLLFLTDDRGVPSEAVWVHLS